MTRIKREGLETVERDRKEGVYANLGVEAYR